MSDIVISPYPDPSGKDTIIEGPLSDKEQRRNRKAAVRLFESNFPIYQKEINALNKALGKAMDLSKLDDLPEEFRTLIKHGFDTFKLVESSIINPRETSFKTDAGVISVTPTEITFRPHMTAHDISSFTPETAIAMATICALNENIANDGFSDARTRETPDLEEPVHVDGAVRIRAWGADDKYQATQHINYTLGHFLDKRGTNRVPTLTTTKTTALSVVNKKIRAGIDDICEDIQQILFSRALDRTTDFFERLGEGFYEMQTTGDIDYTIGAPQAFNLEANPQEAYEEAHRDYATRAYIEKRLLELYEIAVDYAHSKNDEWKKSALAYGVGITDHPTDYHRRLDRLIIREFFDLNDDFDVASLENDPANRTVLLDFNEAISFRESDEGVDVPGLETPQKTLTNDHLFVSDIAFEAVNKLLDSRRSPNP